MRYGIYRYLRFLRFIRAFMAILNHLPYGIYTAKFPCHKATAVHNFEVHLFSTSV